MDQYDYLTRDQLISLIRVLGTARGDGRGQAPGDAEGLSEFGERARRDFENSPSPMRIFDHETLKYLAVNDAAVKFYGYSREEFLALTLKDTRHPDEHAEQRATLKESAGYLRYGKPRRQIKKSGEVAVTEAVTQDILFNGRKARLTLTIDITGRLRMQEMLWQRQQEFESLAENLPDLVARYNRDRRFLYVNSAIEKVFGLDRGQIVGKTQRELGLPEEIAALYDDSLSGVFATGEPHKIEFCMVLPSGERQYEAHHVPEMDAAGTVGSVLCVARDITERKRIEQALRETNEFLHSVIQSSRDCIKVLDLEGRLESMNAAGQRLLEIDDVKSKLGVSLLQFWSDAGREAMAKALEIARHGGTGSFEGYCPTDKGEPKWWDVVVSPILNADGNPERLLAVSRDITSRKQGELAEHRSVELARLLESLARAANEAVTPEAAMVACLERICRHGRWVLGRLELFEQGRPRGATLGRSIWYAPERERFAEFMRITDSHARLESGPFIGKVLRERTAVWIEDWRQKTGYRRWEAAVSHDLRSAFAFPIIARGEVVAVMEVFSDEKRPPDAHIMGAAQSIASQLARIVEREWAHHANARMAAIVESSQDAVLSRALDGTILTWNPAAERLFGYSAAEIVGRKIEVLYPPEVKEDMFRMQELLMQGMPVRSYETVRVAKDGGRVHVSTSPAPIRDFSGNICGVSTIMRDITERKRIELAILRNDELARLQASMAHAANEANTPEDAMLACLARICAFGNWAFGRVTLYEDRGTGDGLSPHSIWHAPDRERFAEYMKFSDDWTYKKTGPFIGRVLRERVAVWIEDLQQEMTFGRREAAIRHGLRSGFAFPIIAHGEVVATMEAYSDTVRPEDPLTMSAVQSLGSQLARIVERERAHQANARMAAIVESSHDAIVSRTLDGTILTWNPGAEKLFGYTAAEIVGRNIEILWPPELTTDMRRRHTLLVRGLAGPAYETVRVAKDGRRVHVSTSPTPIRDSSGNVCGVSTIVRDISERKIAEQNLSESRERLEWVLEATGIGLWLNPLPLSELNWDSRTCELFFLPPGARPTVEWFWKRLHPEDREPTRLAVEAALRDKTLYAIDHRVVSPKTGEIRWIRSAGKAIYDASGTAIRFDGINYDITDEKQAESERLDHTVRQRDALVREVHHRIKNSLQGVVGLLRQKIRKNPSIAPDIEETISQLQSVALVYGLQETRPDGLVNLAEITDAICSSAGNLIGGRLERIFERQSQGPACVVAREAVSVAVALNELVINALKHQPARAGQKHVRIILRETADEAEIRISNRGHLPAGFDYHGGRAAGNGLELVRTLLAAPGGTITFNGARGEVEVVLKLSPPLLAERQRPSQGKR